MTAAFQKTEFENEDFKSKLSADGIYSRIFFDFSVNIICKLCGIKYKHGYSDSKVISRTQEGGDHGLFSSTKEPPLCNC